MIKMNDLIILIAVSAILMAIKTNIASSLLFSYDSSEAVLNWELPPSIRQPVIEQFSDEDDLLIRQLSKAVPGTYQYKPSTALQMVKPRSLNEYEDEDGDDGQDDSSETLAKHLTKLAASSSNTNYQSSGLIPLTGGQSSYTPMEVVPLDYLKYLKDLDDVDPKILNRYKLNKRKKAMSSNLDNLHKKLPLTDGKRKSRNKNKSKVSKKKSYYDDDEIIPEDGSEINSHRHSGNNQELATLLTRLLIVSVLSGRNESGPPCPSTRMDI